MTDRETGKLKGFGFCEYMDLATAESAKRNLNGRDYNGRQLRVDFAGEDGEGGAKTAAPSPAGAGAPAALNYDAPMGTAAAADAARQMGAGAGAGMDAITARLAEMSPAQLYAVMQQLKTLTQTNPSQARQLLANNPQLTLGLFQAQLALGMAKPPGPGAMGGAGAMPPGPPGLPPGAPGPPGMGTRPGPPPPPHPGMQPQMGAYAGAGAPLPPPPGLPMGQAPLPGPPPMMGGGGIAPLPTPTRTMGGPPAPAPAPPAPPDQQQHLLAQVMSMTPEQMTLLPPDQRQQVEMLRQIARQQGMM